MRNAKGFQTFVQNIVEKWNVANPEQPFDLLEQDRQKMMQLTIVNPDGCSAPLRIMQLAPNLTYISQPLQSDGASDPGVTFLTLKGVFYAIGIQQLGFTYRNYVTVSLKDNASWAWVIHRYNAYWYNDLNGAFCNQFWVKALRHQDFGKLRPKTIRGDNWNLISAEWDSFVEWEKKS